jgi:hypothetical protein
MTLCPIAAAKPSTISVLLFPSRPIAIVRSVISIIIQPLKHHFSMRSRTHVGVESLERATPVFTDGNTPSPITRISKVLRIFATCDHRTPSIIFDCSSPSVRNRARPYLFEAQAAAGTCVSTPKSALVNDLLRTAFAFALPPSQIFPWFSFFNHCESSVDLANHASNCIRGDRRVKLL